MKVKIIGHGYVGQAMSKLFPHAIVVDPKYSHYPSSKDKVADVAFVCVPTPLDKSGVLDCSIVDEAVRECPEQFIVIRSTVMPGVSYTLAEAYQKRIVYQPEYLGETVSHPLLDMKERPFMVLGGEPEDRRKVIELYQSVYSANIRIRQVSLLEAEIIKLTENRAIAFKVAQCQELFDVCEAADVDYYTIRDAVYGDDPRFNLWWTFVYPDKRGFQSKCIPKDVYAWAAWAESCGIEPYVTKNILMANEQYLKERVTV